MLPFAKGRFGYSHAVYNERRLAPLRLHARSAHRGRHFADGGYAFQSQNTRAGKRIEGRFCIKMPPILLINGNAVLKLKSNHKNHWFPYQSAGISMKQAELS